MIDFSKWPFSLRPVSADPDVSKHYRKRTTVRNVTRESRAEMAKALGIRKSTLYAHIAKGTLDRAGLKGGIGLTFMGRDYPSGRAAGRATGICPMRINRHRRNGTLAKLEAALREAGNDHRG